ncbi:CHC2 zinc finger domain-containing protein [Budvicia aquatica]|uniref:DNA primase n=1 Tax=Budvicia aquatica TaxID=82979 RepID=A0A2C6DQ07_9GAMM|nr:CHC2 zinc finger domain-containing protein [Budvicia aquatica]PHI30874.1 hypothetical protein CRN84_16790 [Budvicia aquatica]VFS50729.1 DNA primase [Budvicia aquatica]
MKNVKCMKVNFNEIKSSIDLAATIAAIEGQPLVYHGEKRAYLDDKSCPFCPGSGFTIHLDSQHYHCYSCEAHGDVIDYVFYAENTVDRYEAALMLRDGKIGVACFS